MNDLKLSCGDFAFPLLSHDVALDLIKAMGFSGVDIGLFENRSHLQPSDQFINIKKNALELKHELDKRDLVAADIFVQGSLDFREYASNHMDDQRRLYARNLFLKALEYADEVKADHLSALPGVVFEQEGFEASFDRCISEHAWRVDQAKKAGIHFGIEAHVGSIIEDVKNAFDLVTKVPGLGLTLDYSHFVRLGKKDVDCDLLLPYANHFHARGAANGRLQTSVAESEIDFKRIIAKLIRREYNGWITVEYCWTPNWEDCGRNDNVSETILMKEIIQKV